MLRNLKIQTGVADMLGSSLSSGRLHHGYLFEGGAGTGKFDVAIAFTQAALCPEAPDVGCGECSTCRRVANFTHPDFRIYWLTGQLAPQYAELWHDEDAIWELYDKRSKDKKNFPGAKDELRKTASFLIESIRALQEAVGRPPSEAKRKIFIILQPEKMTEEAANALLKTLEEPPPNTILLLLSDQSRNLLTTILSRSLVVKFPPLPNEQVVSELATRYGISGEEAKDAAQRSNGSYITAKRLLSDEHKDMMDAAVKIVSGIAKKPNAAYLLAAAETFRDKDMAFRLIEVLTEIYRNLALSDTGIGDISINDGMGEIINSGKKLPVDALTGIEALAEAQTALEANSHPRLTLEHLLLKLGGLN